MAFPWPLDKLAVINSALTSTGDNKVNVADDGSDEWDIAGSAYDTAIAYVMESHSWGFATRIVTLQPSPIPPDDTDWDTAYPIPPDSVFIIWIKINQDLTETVASLVNTLTLYDIQTVTGVVLPCIVINAQGGPPPPPTPVTPAAVTMKYISNSGPLTDAQSGTPTLILALQTMVMSGIYRGLHEEPQEADKMWIAGKQILQEARTRFDQQKPKRQFFNSRITAARRIRRPWPPVGTNNWGGGGVPG